MSPSSSSSSPSTSSSPSSTSSSDQIQIFEPFFSKVGELIEDYTHKFKKSIKDFKLNLKSLRKSLTLLNSKASDVEEQIKFIEGSRQKKRKREFEEWLTRVKSIENEVIQLRSQSESEGFIKPLMDGGKVIQLNNKVAMLVEQIKHLDELLPRGVDLLTTTMVGEAFEENMKRIWAILFTKEVSIIGIHGMGGVGKTALAKCTNNRLLKQSQRRVFWITVSQEFTIKSLQDKIGCFIGLDLLDEDDEDIRAARLHKVLSQMNNSVLILDDLWDYIDLLKVGCPISTQCCRLVITSRSVQVCRQMCCQRIIKVKTLCEDEAWRLFVATLASGKKIKIGPEAKTLCEEAAWKTFTSGEEIKIVPEAETIAKVVARLCCGLPLRIILVARRMRDVGPLYSWQFTRWWTTALTELKESQARQDGSGDVEFFRLLKYSFDRLNNQNQSKEFNLLQRCFLYCSFYCQGRSLDKDKLVERLISEGLVDVRMSRAAHVDKGRALLDYLVDECLLESDNLAVKMNDLVRGMALKIGEWKYVVRAGDKSLMEIPHEQAWPMGLEKAFLMCNNIRSIPDGTSPNCPNLSTLILHDNPLRAIPDSFFSRMKHLSTLDLCRTHITTLPNIISDLTRLEAFLLEECGTLEKVPYLGKLKALRELNLSYTAIEEVPEGVEELLCLRSLSMYARDLEMLPRGLLLKLVHLQSVTFPFEVVIPAEEIQNLKEVEKFYGRLNDVHAFNCLVTNQKHQVLFQVQIGPELAEADESFLYDDREVFLFKYNLEGAKVFGRDIQALTIKECEGLSKCLLDDFSPSSYPESLVILAIRRCGGIEWLLTSSRESQSQFSTIDRMELEELEHFKGLIQKGELGDVPAAPAQAIFSSLLRLTIANCNEMKKLGLPTSAAPKLEELTIAKCGEIEEIFEDEGKDCVFLPRLEELILSELPRLKSFCKAKLICNSVREISITKCPRLNRNMPLHIDDPPQPSLNYLYVEREWWESLEWKDNLNLPELLKPFLCFS